MSTLPPQTRELLHQFQLNPAYAKASPAAIRRFGLTTQEPILDLLPTSIQQLALALPPDQLEMTEDELERIYAPARHDRRLKAAFWDEFERAARQSRQIDPTQITLGTGITHWEQYESRLLSNPTLACWFLTPPVHYRVQLKEAMSLSMKRLMDVLELPLLDHRGRPQVGVGLLILQAVKFLDARINGAITQKQIQVSVSQHETTQNGALPDGSTARLDMKAIDSRIAELEQQMMERNASDMQIPHISSPSNTPKIPSAQSGDRVLVARGRTLLDRGDGPLESTTVESPHTDTSSVNKSKVTVQDLETEGDGSGTIFVRDDTTKTGFDTYDAEGNHTTHDLDLSPPEGPY